MRIAYFDCFSGISGDMTVGAFLDAGLSFEDLKNELSKINLQGYELRTEPSVKHGIRGTRFVVDAAGSHEHRTFSDIKTLIETSGLHRRVKDTSLGIFSLLAAAESMIHGIPAEQVHFHEVGAVDSIIDIVGCAAALHILEIGEVRSSPVPLGSGFVNSMHGRLPVPAPATLELLKGKPVYSGNITREVTTPTGAAILAYCAVNFGEIPAMKPTMTGYGAGAADFEIPNMLRIIIGETASAGSMERVMVMETNVDDMNPEFCEYLSECLFDAGALDVAAIPIMMKKFRPAVMLQVVAPVGLRDACAAIIFRETTTAGIRYHFMERVTLPGESVTVTTAYGDVRVKVIRGSGSLTISPEYEDCKSIAHKTGVPLKEIYDAARLGAKAKL